MITAAVIGAGYIGREHLGALRDLPEVKTVGVCDLSPVMAEAAAEEFEVAAWFTDHRSMLRELRPKVVHVTTPSQAHVALAIDVLEAGAHALVETPITLDPGGLKKLLRTAHERGRLLLESYNYLFNPPVQEILDLIRSGVFGEFVHADVQVFIDILGERSKYADSKPPSPFLSPPGEAMADFITHLACLGHSFIGEHREVQTRWQKRGVGEMVPWDEFGALIDGERGTVSLGFSSRAQPAVFSLRVQGTRMRATASLFKPLLCIEKLRAAPRPLTHLFNGLSAARAYANCTITGIWRELQGRPATYQGLRLLIKQLYEALETGAEPPITLHQIEAVNHLVGDLLAGSERS